MKPLLFVIGAAVGIAGFFGYQHFTQPSFGSVTAIQGTDTLSSSRTVINSNFSNLDTGKFNLADWYATTSAPQLTSVGTLSSLNVSGSVFSSSTVYTSGYFDTTNIINGSAGYRIGGNLVLQATSTNFSSLLLGKGAGAGLQVGSDYNTLLGYNAGSLITTGSQNIVIGATTVTSRDNLTTGSNNIKIGINLSIPQPTANNQLNIGNLIYGRNLDGDTLTYSTGQIGIGTSSPQERFGIHANNGDTNRMLFAVASSTQSATSTLFSIDNVGNVKVSSTATTTQSIQSTSGSKGGRLIIMDTNGTTCTELSTNAGVLSAKAVTCP